MPSQAKGSVWVFMYYLSPNIKIDIKMEFQREKDNWCHNVATNTLKQGSYTHDANLEITTLHRPIKLPCRLLTRKAERCGEASKKSKQAAISHPLTHSTTDQCLSLQPAIPKAQAAGSGPCWVKGGCKYCSDYTSNACSPLSTVLPRPPQHELLHHPQFLDAPFCPMQKIPL